MRPVAKQIRGSVIPVAAISLRMSFMALVNGELDPSQADCPTWACNTMIYFAIASDAIKLANNFVLVEKPDIIIIIPDMYRISATVPAEPIAGSSIALCFASFPPLTIRPSAKSASASTWDIPVMAISANTTIKPTTSGGKYMEIINASAPTANPIIAPTIGKTCIPRAISLISILEDLLDIGITERNEIAPLSSLNTKYYIPPPY